MNLIQKQIRFGSISTSETELKDISKAWIAISIAFAIVLNGSIFSSDFYTKFVVASLTVGIGFLFHELGHKIVAQKYGCFAEFRSFDNMLLSLIFLQLPKLFKDIAYYGFLINSWLALFNMIPFWLFDGYKILKWNKMVYGGIVAVAFMFML